MAHSSANSPLLPSLRLNSPQIYDYLPFFGLDEQSMPKSAVKRSIACKQCHKRKIKCSGERPQCAACVAGRAECIYPVRDRKTEVGQKYLENILEENKRLSELVKQSQTPVQSGSTSATAAPVLPRADNADRNPMIEERPWFMSFHAVDLPIHIGEAADAAFATRLRQAVSKQPVSHLPRIQYVEDDVLRSLAEQPPEWPSPSHLKYLVDTALKSFGKTFHIVRKSVIRKSVQKLIQSPSSCDWLTQCQIWSLLAIGEAYSARSALPNRPFPGARYWATAMSLMYMPFERPSLQVIEVHLLLSFYAVAINRRHTALLLASQAVRIGVILGLHIDISETQLRDKALREHRCRLFWTAYRLDRAWCSKVGWPPAIPDETVEIPLPSDQNVPEEAKDDFEDVQFIIFAIKLARMHNQAVNTLYVRKRQPTSFSERVQVAVRAMRDWADELPAHLRVGPAESSPIVEAHVLYQHLAYNQAVIVTTRPILLHLLRQRRLHTANNPGIPAPAPSDSVKSLANACIHSARQSMNWLKRSWAEGTFPTFDYFSMQFLFSAATILALSALMREPGCASDQEDFQLACSFLQQLERSGNYGAKEYFTHVEAIQATLAENLVGLTDVSPASYNFAGAPATPRSIENERMPMQMAQLQGAPLQDFLSQGNLLDLDFMDTGGQWIDWQDVFWPQIELPSTLQ